VKYALLKLTQRLSPILIAVVALVPLRDALAAVRLELDEKSQYCCAAESMFMVCQICGRPVRYAKCLQMLPSTPEGTSMAALAAALRQSGLFVQPYMLDVDDYWRVALPAIVLVPPSRDTFTFPSNRVGHFFVTRPEGANNLQVLNYPFRDPTTLITGAFEQELGNLGVREVPVLLCSATQRGADDWLRPPALESRPGLGDTSSPPSAATGSNETTTAITDNRPPTLTAWDFGTAEPGAKLIHEFVLHNGANHTITIATVEPGCSCTVAKLDRTTIPPGGDGRIDLSVSTVGRYGGRLSVLILVNFAKEDGLSPVILQVSGNIIRRWFAMPDELDFGRVEKSAAPITRQLVITRDDGVGLDAGGEVQTDIPGISISTIGRQNSAPGGTIIKITLDPSEAVGGIDGMIQVADRGQAPRAWPVARVFGQIVPVVSLCPAQLISAEDNHGAATATAVLLNVDGARVTVVSTAIADETADGDVEVENEPEANGTTNLVIECHSQSHAWCSGTIQITARVSGASGTRKIDLPFVFLGN